MPDNPLTAILKDFRSYRPAPHNAFLSWTETESRRVGVVEFAKEDVDSSALLLVALDQVREFRDRHWKFTYTPSMLTTCSKEYILRHTDHPVATGGSPIVSWLPNQLAVVLDTMIDLYTDLSSRDLNSSSIKIYDAVLENEEFHAARAVETLVVKDIVQECGERAAVEKSILVQEVQQFSKAKGQTAVDAESKF